MTPRPIPALVATLRTSFDSGRTVPLAWRRAQLKGLASLLRVHEEEIGAALTADLRKPAWEAYAAETSFLQNEIAHALKHLAGWTRPRRVPTPIVAQPGTSRIVAQPRGVVLNLAAWNYPLHIALAPAVSALAAGNCVVIKPSERAPASSAVLAELLPKFLDPACVAVVEGGVEAATTLLEQRFDHICFTGGEAIGRIVMTAAAKTLTPVMLELGGKSPCYVDRSADLAVAARRILWAKFMNAGQTCVAPDYLMVHEDVEEELVDRMRRALTRWYGEDPQTSADYARLIDVRHVRHLAGLLDQGEVVVGGKVDEDDRYIAPTLLRNVPLDAPVMQQEIFGPILPIFRVAGAAEAIAFIRERPKPLALYVFADDRAVQRQVLARTTSGGACVNDAAVQLGVPALPFGGVGRSGIGAYHGRPGFDAFSHLRSVVTRSTAVDPSLRYPPFSESKLSWLRRLL